MPEIKRNFLKGRMNQDLDERIIPQGEYRDGYNIQISSTEASDVGAVQNILGNRYANCTLDSNNECIPGEFATTYGLSGSCVGSIANEETNKIYLFIKGTTVNGIIEFDTTTNKSVPVIIDARVGTTEDTKNILNFTSTQITGLTILQDYLIWTDNNSEPKVIDISSTSVFKSGSLITVDDAKIASYDQTTRVNNRAFLESDITLIRKKPSNAPKVKFTTVAVLNTANASTDLTTHKEKFVRFAYRWKFTNGQYSVLSPFSDPVFFPSSTLDYDIDEGWNNQMKNNITGATLMNMEVGNGADKNTGDGGKGCYKTNRIR